MCNSNFISEASFEEHMDWHKNAPSIILDIVPNEEEPKTTKVFLEPRKNISRLQEPMEVIHETTDDTNFKCTHCFMLCNSYLGLKRHILMLHKTSSGKPHRCEQCLKTFKTVPGLKGHMFQHPHGRFAQPTLYNNPNWQKDKRTNPTDTQFEWDDVEKKFKCKLCVAKFRVAQDLKRHIYSHTGEKPFSCHQCGKGFIRSYSMKTHIRTHRNEKPYVCPECGLGFTVGKGLKRHMYSHLEHKPFKCNVCEKEFTQRHALQIHIRTHTGENLYGCQDCDKRFTEKKGLRRHSLKKHVA